MVVRGLESKSESIVEIPIMSKAAAKVNSSRHKKKGLSNYGSQKRISYYRSSMLNIGVNGVR